MSRVRLVLLGLLVCVSATRLAVIHDDTMVGVADCWLTRISPERWR